MSNDRNRITLIYPPGFTNRYVPSPPLSLAVISAQLKELDVPHRVVDLDQISFQAGFFPTQSPKNQTRDQRAQTLAEKLAPQMDDILTQSSAVWFSIMSVEQFNIVRHLAAMAKEHGATTVIGGAFVTANLAHLRDEALPEFDTLVSGRAEWVIDDLIAGCEGAITAERGFRHRPTRPDYSAFDLDGYRQDLRLSGEPSLLLPIEFSTGCRYRCQFCSISELRLDAIDPDQVVGEMERLSSETGCSRFHFVDNGINLDKRWVDDLCAQLADRSFLWSAYGVLAGIDATRAEKLFDAGARQLRFGLETASDRLLRRVKKPFTAAQAADVLRATAEAGILNHVLLVLGFPGETSDDVNDTIQFLKKYAQWIDTVSPSPHVIFGGSLDSEKSRLAKTKRTRKSILDYGCLVPGGIPWAMRRFGKKYARVKACIDELEVAATTFGYDKTQPESFILTRPFCK